MSAGSSERQGTVGDLDKKPKGELVELLRRQHKLKANKKFIQSMPDKGKRINEFIQKLDAAIARHEEVERTAELLSAVKLEFQVVQVEMTFDKEEDLTNEVVTSTLTAQQVWNETEKDQYVLSKINVQSGVKNENSEVCIENQKSNPVRGTVLEKEQATLAIQSSKVSTKSENSLDSQMHHQSTVDIKQEGNNHLDLHNATNVMDGDFDETTELLADRFGKVSLTENEHRKVPKKIHEEPTLISDVKFTDNPFRTLHQVKKNPHYVDVLQHRAMNPLVKKAQFKTNHLSGSPGSSPDHSPGRSELKLSPAERRLRDRKHLDDITAARLPPLYHSPIQLLSFEESAELQISQKQTYESTQAKQAAEKLSQRMNIKMVTFDLQHEAVAAYPGFRDHGDSSSSEDDLN